LTDELHPRPWSQRGVRRPCPGLARRPCRFGLALRAFSGGGLVRRTKEYLSKIKGKKSDPDRFAEPETLTLAPLPCWKHLSPAGSTSPPRPSGLRSRASSSRSKKTPRPGERPAAANPFGPTPSCGRNRGPSQTGPRSRRLPASTPSASGSAKSSTNLHPLRAGLPRGRRAVEIGESQRPIPNRLLLAASSFRRDSRSSTSPTRRQSATHSAVRNSSAPPQPSCLFRLPLARLRSLEREPDGLPSRQPDDLRPCMAVV
jgi:hypothetical protein